LLITNVQCTCNVPCNVPCKCLNYKNKTLAPQKNIAEVFRGLRKRWGFISTPLSILYKLTQVSQHLVCQMLRI